MNRYSEEEFEKGKRASRAERKIASRKDRSKFKKTDQKKRERIFKAESEKKLAKKQLKRGRVLKISADKIFVDSEGQEYVCGLRGVLKKEYSHAKNLVAVGDFVLFEIENDQKGTIAHIEERYSFLSRKEHLHRRRQQLIAANIDQVLITASVVEPMLKPALIDRYIIASKKGQMQPVIVINKIDLLEEGTEEKDRYEEFLRTYRKLNIPVVGLSANTGEGLEDLKAQMQGKASVFSGQSGVGKSSLINAMTGLNLTTQDLAKKTRKGAHTTTHAHLIPLEFGGWCIDTPGIRSFGVWDLTREDLASYFPEIQKFRWECKYPNCTHSHEPGCAVIAAVEIGEISPLRYDSYLKLLSEV